MPLKDDLHREFPRIHDFNTKQALKASDKGTNLVRLYGKFATSEHAALKDIEMEAKTAA